MPPARVRAAIRFRRTTEQAPARQLYENLYCARAGMEHRVKEQMCLLNPWGMAKVRSSRVGQRR